MDTYPTYTICSSCSLHIIVVIISKSIAYLVITLFFILKVNTVRYQSIVEYELDILFTLLDGVVS